MVMDKQTEETLRDLGATVRYREAAEPGCGGVFAYVDALGKLVELAARISGASS